MTEKKTIKKSNLEKKTQRKKVPLIKKEITLKKTIDKKIVPKSVATKQKPELEPKAKVKGKTIVNKKIIKETTKVTRSLKDLLNKKPVINVPPSSDIFLVDDEKHLNELITIMNDQKLDLRREELDGHKYLRESLRKHVLTILKHKKEFKLFLDLQNSIQTSLVNLKSLAAPRAKLSIQELFLIYRLSLMYCFNTINIDPIKKPSIDIPVFKTLEDLIKKFPVYIQECFEYIKYLNKL